MNTEKIDPKQIIEKLPNISTKATGIYGIYCAANNKIYIGQTKTIGGFVKRFRDHRNFLKKNDHANRHFQSCWNSHPEQFWLFFPIEEIALTEPVEYFTEREDYWLDLIKEEFKLNSNTAYKAYRFSEEHKQNISIAKKKYYETHPSAQKGKKLSPEHIQNMRESRLGNVVSEETKQKLSIALSGDKNPMYGKKHSEETREKITKANLGRKLDEETKMKMSLSRIGKVKSEEHKQNISKALTGLKRSEETLEKMRNVVITEETREKNSWGQIRKDIKECLLAQNIEPTIENINIEFEKRKNVVISARQMRKEGMTYTDIGKNFGLARKTVEKFTRGTTWKYLPL